MNVRLAIVVVAVLLSSACGELNSTMSPSVTTVGCTAQTAGSTVSILDMHPGC